MQHAYADLVLHESTQINEQLLDDDYQYLFCDGVWESVRGNGWDNTKAVVLCVLGMKRDGSRKLLGFTLARAEDATSWQALLGSLKQRGLMGKTLDLVVMDDSAGLMAALQHVYPTIPVQHCLVHKLRVVMARTSYRNRAAVTEDLKAITNANSPDEATTAAKDIVKKWFIREEAAMNSLKHNFEYCTTYFQFPKSEWTKIRTTNLIEREFREVRRRTKVNDHSFTNVESARRYHEGIFQYLNQHYPAK